MFSPWAKEEDKFGGVGLEPFPASMGQRLETQYALSAPDLPALWGFPEFPHLLLLCILFSGKGVTFPFLAFYLNLVQGCGIRLDPFLFVSSWKTCSLLFLFFKFMSFTFKSGFERDFRKGA